MEVDAAMYPNIDDSDFLEIKDDDSQSIIVKKTLISPPIFVDIYPNFMVKVNKPFRGLSGMTLNDEEYQNLLPNESTSQLDAFDDGDGDDLLLMELDDEDAAGIEDPVESVYDSVKVIVKSKSLIVDQIEFPTNVEIRSTTLIKGKQNPDGSFEEDSLFVCLKSGYLLLIRLYYVPRYYKDSDYEYQTSEIKHEGNSIFKPFAVQWWDANAASLKSSGFHLRSDRSGLSAVSTSAYRSFRIYNTDSTANGIILRKHHNVFVDGLILHSCFAEPLHESAITGHVSFLTMVYTDHRRLWLQFYSWSCDEGSSMNLSKSALPLDNTFQIPIFIVPLKLNGGFLLVLPDEVVIVTIHQIISAEYDFKKFAAPWKNSSFPTNFYCPTTNITVNLDTLEEVLISTDNGTIYSLKMDGIDNGVLFQPILRIPNTISVFSLERLENDYILIFGSNGENNQELLISTLFSEEYIQSIVSQNKLHYINARLLRNYSNWSPLIDIQVIDSATLQNIISNKKELWGLTGNGKRSKITHFRHGYSAKRTSKIYDKLRKCTRLFYTTLQDRTYLLCSFSFKSILIEIQTESEYSFLEIDNITIAEPILFAITLKLENFEAILYITASSIILTDFTDLKISEIMGNKTIVFATLEGSHLALIVEELINDELVLTLELYLVNLEISSTSETLIGNIFTRIEMWPLIYQPSSIILFPFKETVVVGVGSYQGNLYFYNHSESLDPICENLKERIVRTTKNHPEMLLLIPCDIRFINDSVFVGTTDGYVITLLVTENFEFVCTRFLQLSETPVHFSETEDSKSILFIYSKHLWLLNLYESEFPERVYFDETNERSVAFGAKFTNQSGSSGLKENLAVIREDGLMTISVLSFKEPSLRQVSIGEKARKFQYLAQYGLFVVMCKSKHEDARLKFIERKALKVLPHHEFGLKSNEEPGNIFKSNEHPISSCIWTIKRGDRFSKKLLIGCSIDSDSRGLLGCIKVLDIMKFKTHPNMNISIRVFELTSFAFELLVTQVVQVEESILFSAGSSVFCTRYDADIKKLKPALCLTTLPSDITSMDYVDDILLVTTKYDSLFQFTFTISSKGMSLHNSFHDATPNSFVNHAILNSRIFAGDKLHSSILIVNDDKTNTRTTFRVSCISRVYASDFNCPWENMLSNDENDTKIICVGVNGEVFFLRMVKQNSVELRQLSDLLEVSGNSASLNEIVDKWMVPVRNKVSGTGLFSFNKLCFDYKENIGKLIDYDLDSLKSSCPSRVYL